MVIDPHALIKIQKRCTVYLSNLLFNKIIFTMLEFKLLVGESHLYILLADFMANRVQTSYVLMLPTSSHLTPSRTHQIRNPDRFAVCPPYELRSCGKPG